VRRHSVVKTVELGGALFLAMALGCAAPSPASRVPAPASSAHPPAGGSNPLDALLQRDLAEDYAFPWSPARPLTWNDFQGRPPAEGPEGAKTAYTLYSVWKCRGEAFEFRIIVAFRPRESWVKTLVLKDSIQRRTVLAHEQTHFDLAEVHVRRMRQAFRNVTDPCRNTDAVIGALADRLGQEEKVEQRRYDTETNHGLRAEQQAAWTLDTRRRLAVSQ
jgi:Bacterial protein of unknown function (DUF922)